MILINLNPKKLFKIHQKALKLSQLCFDHNKYTHQLLSHHIIPNYTKILLIFLN